MEHLGVCLVTFQVHRLPIRLCERRECRRVGAYHGATLWVDVSFMARSKRRRTKINCAPEQNSDSKRYPIGGVNLLHTKSVTFPQPIHKIILESSQLVSRALRLWHKGGALLQVIFVFGLLTQNCLTPQGVWFSYRSTFGSK